MEHDKIKVKRESGFRIAICDDDPEQTGALGSVFLSAAKELKLSAEVELFTSAIALLDKIELASTENSIYDIVVLDIRQPELDGITFGKRLYAMQTGAELILVTAYPSYAIEGYETHAFQFLVKPVSKETAVHVMRAILQKHGEDKCIYLNTAGRKEVIALKDIECIISDSKYSKIHTKNASFLDLTPINRYEDLLLRYGFIRVHRSALINVKAYQSMQGYTLTLESGKTVPVSRRRISYVRSALRKELERRMI